MTGSRRSLLSAGLGGLGGVCGLGTTGAAVGGVGSLVGAAGCVEAAFVDDRDAFDAGAADARVGFVGDVMLGRGVNDRWADRDPTGVWGGARDRLQACSGVVVNLECCISNRGRPRPQKTFTFRANPTFAKTALTDVDVALAALANNHVLDFGTPALEDTLIHLDDAGIAHAGAGGDRERAFEPAVATVDDLTVAMISLTDQYQPYAATTTDPGTAYATLDHTDPTTRSLVGDAIEATTHGGRADRTGTDDAHANVDGDDAGGDGDGDDAGGDGDGDDAGGDGVDLVVASLHWGANYETAPSDTYQAFAHWLVENGVDVVHGHSAHILQGIEIHQGRPIIYDAGDFVDDYIHKDGYENKLSAIFELVVDDGTFDRLEITPTQIEGRAAEIADPDAAATVRAILRERSQPFGTPIERDGDGLTIALG